MFRSGFYQKNRVDKIAQSVKLTSSDFRFFTKAFHSNPFRAYLILNLAQPLNPATKLIFGVLLFIFIKRCCNMEV